MRLKKEASPEIIERVRGIWQCMPIINYSREDLRELFLFYYTYVSVLDGNSEAFLQKQMNCGWCVSRVVFWFKNNMKNE